MQGEQGEVYFTEKCKKIMPVLQATFVYASLDFAKGS